jgi:hypothetical protein
VRSAEGLRGGTVTCADISRPRLRRLIASASAILAITFLVLLSGGSPARAATDPLAAIQGRWTSHDGTMVTEIRGNTGKFVKVPEPDTCRYNNWTYISNITSLGGDRYRALVRPPYPPGSPCGPVSQPGWRVLTLTTDGLTQNLSSGDYFILTRTFCAPTASADGGPATRSTTSRRIVPIATGFNDLEAFGPGYAHYSVVVVDAPPEYGECPAPITAAEVAITSMARPSQFSATGQGMAALSIPSWDRAHITVNLARPTYGAYAVITSESE